MELKSFSMVDAAPAEEAAIRERKLKKACQGFESMFVKQLLKGMRDTVIRAESPDHAREMYEGMMDDALATAVCEGPGMGLGASLYEELAPLLLADLNNGRGKESPGAGQAAALSHDDSSKSLKDPMGETDEYTSSGATEDKKQ